MKITKGFGCPHEKSCSEAEPRNTGYSLIGSVEEASASRREVPLERKLSKLVPRPLSRLAVVTGYSATGDIVINKRQTAFGRHLL